MTASTMRERRFPGVLWRREARPIVAAADGGASFTLERLALRLSLALLGGRPTTIQGSPSTGLGAPAKMSMTLLDNSCLGAGWAMTGASALRAVLGVLRALMNSLARPGCAE